MRERQLLETRADHLSEATIRYTLQLHLVETSHCVVEEFWIPGSHTRADLVALSNQMYGYEIKSDRDSLQRLPGQVDAYSSVFTRCTLVTTNRHLGDATNILPDWWAILLVSNDNGMSIEPIRHGDVNPSLDTGTLVRLLWKDEALGLLRELGIDRANVRERYKMWEMLVANCEAERLSVLVCDALIRRSAAAARIKTRRFSNHQWLH